MKQVEGPSAESQPQKELMSPQEIRQIIVDGDAEVLVNCAERVGKRLKEMNLATFQIRPIIGGIHKIELNWPSSPAEAQRELFLLKTKLAREAKRVKETVDGLEVFPIEELREVICRVVDIVLEQPDDLDVEAKQKAHETERQKAIRRLVNFFEAIVAYHSYHGGRV
jgi:CRISPR type III-A-associated protein Csm2